MTIGTRLAASCLILALFVAPASQADDAAGWDPTAWRDEDTIELRTTAPGGEPHWFKVWLVVLDGQLYVRLGSRAARRFEENASRPSVAVRIAGREFPAVVGTPVPDMAERVAAAMADKYWTDVFVRYMDHPLTLRLAPG
ncbi:MAG: hypothetical protein AB1689_08405 [Thermodesulfobacteriota bacterium]